MRTITKGLLKRLQQLVTSLGPTLLAVLRGVGESVQAVQTLLAETLAMLATFSIIMKQKKCWELLVQKIGA